MPPDLRDLRSRIALWKSAFDGDANSITRSLSELAWRIAVFSCVVEMVAQAERNEGEAKRLNGAVLDLLGSCFWESTFLAIRRLVDSSHPVDGPNGVCSLGALITDVKAVRRKVTRRVYVEEIAGLRYNYEASQREKWQHLMDQGPGGHWVPMNLDPHQSSRRHAEFDWLSGTTPGTCHPDDVIRQDIFDLLETRLRNLDQVVTHATKQHAHAANEASRHGHVLEAWGLRDAKNVLKQLAQVAELVGRWFCYSGVGTVLPTPQFDQFRHLEAPLFAGNKETLRAVWQEFADEVECWHAIESHEV